FGNSAAPTTVITDFDETLGLIELDSAQPYTITVNGLGQGTIHLATQYPFAEVTALQGSHTIFSPILMHKDAVFSVNQGTATLTVPTIIAENAGSINLTKAGAGKLVTSSVVMNNLNVNG